MKVGKYRGYEIWLTKKGYFKAYDSNGVGLIRNRITLSGIKKVIRERARETQ